MFDSEQYELLDFGGGRKLERFGRFVLDRPSPAAIDVQPARADEWPKADARFELQAGGKPAPQRGRWLGQEPGEGWTVHHAKSVFQLKLTEFGHVGLFAEQAACWDWIGEQVRANASEARPFRLLNLFAYTGGSTLAAANAGAAVTHVDAARNIVAWARRNAELSGLASAPVRWIVDDAVKFVRREVKRRRKYEAIVLDPPSYGHGAAGEAWKLEENLPELLAMCRELTEGQLRFVLLTCHAPGYDAARGAECLVDAGLVRNAANVASGDLVLHATDGRELHSGVFARVFD